MKDYSFSEKISKVSDSELEGYLNNKEQFSADEIFAIRWEIDKRELLKDNKYTRIETEQIKISKKKLVENLVEIEQSIPDIILNKTEEAEGIEDEHFPAKPVEEIKQQSIKRSLLSLGLFIGAFYLIFDWDFKYILVLAGVVLVHELGHYLAMKIYKYNDLSIFFIPLLGAYASGTKNTISQKQSVVILLAGPLPGIIIGVILYYYGLLYENQFLISTADIFVLLNMFNLLPVLPLDGGRLIKSMFFESNEIISYVFMFLSIAILAFYSIYSQSYFLLIIPVFLLLQLSSQSQIKKVRRAAESKGLNLNTSFDELSDKEYWLIREELGSNMENYGKIITPKKYAVVEKENKIINQIKSVIQKKPIGDLKIASKIQITILWMLAFILPYIIIAMYYISLGIDAA